MSKKQDPESSAYKLGCVFSLAWVLLTLPVWIGAFVLLAAGTSTEGKLFALALLCLLPVPLNLRHWGNKGRRLVTILLLLVGLTALIVCAARAPEYRDDPEAKARLLYRNGTKHRRFSPANMVPELDQHILGSYLFVLIDPSLSWSKSARLRESFKSVHRDLEKDPELAALPSVLGFAYQDILLGRRPAGNLFVYLPEAKGASEEPKPVILFLHGSLGNFQGYRQIWKSFADEHDFAIVAPTFGAGNWSKKGGLDAIADARAFCADHPRLDADRILLAGISNGGTGVTRAAKATPDAWNGLILISPVLENGVVDTKEFAKAWRDKPALIVSGLKDERTPARSVRKAEQSMTIRGAVVESHYLPKQDHFLAFSDWPKVKELIHKWIESKGLITP